MSAKLERTTFSASRAAEYFDARQVLTDKVGRKPSTPRACCASRSSTTFE